MSNSLRVFISVDMEGISSIVHGGQTGGEPGEYEKGRTLMTADANAAIEGILSMGTAEIVVSDAHGGSCNLRPEELHEAAVLIRGSPKPLTMMSGIGAGFDAAVFIGYHAKKGTKNAILDHTISGGTVDSIRINDIEVGETGINAAIAGYYGVPLVFLSGDLAVSREAEFLIPGITTVAVKEAISRTAARCLNPKKSRELIRQGVVKALQRRREIKPFVFKPPVKIDAAFVNSLMADVVEPMPLTERIDGRTIRIVHNDYVQAFRALRVAITLAGTAAR